MHDTFFSSSHTKNYSRSSPLFVLFQYTDLPNPVCLLTCIAKYIPIIEYPALHSYKQKWFIPFISNPPSWAQTYYFSYTKREPPPGASRFIHAVPIRIPLRFILMTAVAVSPHQKDHLYKCKHLTDAFLAATALLVAYSNSASPKILLNIFV